MVELITDYMDVWTSAQMTKSTAGRGNNGKQTAYGIKKLRELILELAVRGKLVPQDPSDEPASVLLGRIAEEKARLVREGVIKKQTITPEISHNENPFELPEEWEWARWDNVAMKIGDIDHKMPEPVMDGIPYVSPRDFSHKNTIDYDGAKKISIEDFRKLSVKIQPQRGDIIYPRYGTIGENRLVETDRDFLASYSCCVIKTLQGFISPLYQFIFSISELTKQQARKAENKTTQANVGINSIQKYWIPIPPLAEQHRIVAKVDELMALCDQLEQQQTDSTAAHQTLVETLLGTLTQSADPTEFAAAWQRIAEHFDTLFTTEHSIDQLKQTILQLAVMGKLVPQDPNDEPASVLLEKIAEEKARLIKEEKISKQKGLFDACQKKPFELPDGWQWISLSHLGVFSGGKTPSKAKSSYWNGDIPWVTPKDMKIAQIYDTEDHITALAIDDGLALYEPEALLFVVRSGILRRTFPVAISKVHCTVNQDLKVLSLYNKELVSYVYLMMRGFEQYILKNLTKTGVTVESVMFDEFSRHYFMLPPLAEQHRIVAKVDELMALCDTLKARITEAQTTQIQLADAIVGQAVA